MKNINRLMRLVFLFSILLQIEIQAAPIELVVAIQQQEISGVVTDTDGNALPGVAIIIEGTTNGTETDFDGKYTIAAPSGSVLVFAFVGMKTQTITVGSAIKLNVTLQPDTNQLEEVVVVGYGVKKKINLSGAVATVGEEIFESRPVTNVGQALQGTVANLNITGSASPNAVANFNIRGTTSLSGGSPLVVIDGITATQHDLARMNPNDIASVSILKDAASSSIYGSRAAFGVILVTTKKGKSDTMSINVAVNSRILTNGRQPEQEMDPYKFATFQNLMAKPWYNLYSDAELEYARQVSLGNEPSVRINPTNGTTYQYFTQTNWYEETMNKQSFSSSANMNISQKLDKGSYYMSVEGQKNSGSYKYNNDVQKRFNLKLSSDYDLTDWLNLSNKTWIYTNEYDEANTTGSTYLWGLKRNTSLMPAYNTDGTYTSQGAKFIGQMLAGNYLTKERGLQTQFAFTTKFFDDKLTIVADASFKKLLSERAAYDAPVRYSYGTQPGQNSQVGPSSAWASFANWSEEWENYNVYATFTDTYNEKHNVTLLVGYNQEEYNYNSTGGSRSELISNALPTVALATGDQTVYHSASSWAVQGIFARFNYIYNDKYILELNGRYDGSSRYYEDDRWVFNPSASVSWIASKESFLEGSFFDLLKFRVSYGSLGNQSASTYGTHAILPVGNASALIDGANILQASSPGLIAPSYTWETIQTKNVGVDMAFLKNRLSTSFDYYERATLDMFAQGQELPAVLGTSPPDENATDLVTKGWEFTLSWRDQFDVANKPFRYGVNFNLGDSRAYITKFPNELGLLNQWREGQEVGEIWGFVTDGYYQTQEEIDFGHDQVDVTSYPSTRIVKPGDVKFKDLDGDGKIGYGDSTESNPGDRKVIGNSRARYNFGLNLTAEWNGFDFRALFQGVGKKDYYPGNNISFWGQFAQPWSILTKENYNNHWTPESRDAFYPGLKSYVAEWNKEVALSQTRWLQDASYVRLKNLTVGYTIPENSTKKIGTIRIYGSGENLFEVTNLFKYLDPENLSGFGYPFRRTYSIGASINF